MEKTALISDCKKYRYKLSRQWNRDGSMIMFIMLNPSTADADIDDPTIRRCISFAKSWGAGGFYVGNLFAYRSKTPKDLLSALDPIGEENKNHLNDMLNDSVFAVCAWGNFPIIKKLKPETLNFLKNKHVPFRCIDTSINGTPKHPLYLKGDLKPLIFSV